MHATIHPQAKKEALASSYAERLNETLAQRERRITDLAAANQAAAAQAQALVAQVAALQARLPHGAAEGAHAGS